MTELMFVWSHCDIALSPNLQRGLQSAVEIRFCLPSNMLPLLETCRLGKPSLPICEADSSPYSRGGQVTQLCQLEPYTPWPQQLVQGWSCDSNTASEIQSWVFSLNFGEGRLSLFCG